MTNPIDPQIVRPQFQDDETKLKIRQKPLAPKIETSGDEAFSLKWKIGDPVKLNDGLLIHKQDDRD